MPGSTLVRFLKRGKTEAFLPSPREGRVDFLAAGLCHDRVAQIQSRRAAGSDRPWKRAQYRTRRKSLKRDRPQWAGCASAWRSFPIICSAVCGVLDILSSFRWSIPNIVHGPISDGQVRSRDLQTKWPRRHRPCRHGLGAELAHEALGVPSFARPAGVRISRSLYRRPRRAPHRWGRGSRRVHQGTRRI